MSALQPANALQGGAPAALPPAALPPLLVIARGESFRSYGKFSRILVCHNKSRAAQSTAAASHATLLRTLRRSFSVSLSLHTYDVTGCSATLWDLYSECAAALPLAAAACMPSALRL